MRLGQWQRPRGRRRTLSLPSCGSCWPRGLPSCARLDCLGGAGGSRTASSIEWGTPMDISIEVKGAVEGTVPVVIIQCGDISELHGRVDYLCAPDTCRAEPFATIDR